MTVNVLLKISVVYCAVHPAPSSSDTSVVRESVVSCTSRVVRVLVHVLVRESVGTCKVPVPSKKI